MKTLQTAITRIRYRIGEPTASFWTDAELTSYINDAKDDLFNAIMTINKDFFQRSVVLHSSPFMNRILLPADFQRLKKLVMLSNANTSVSFTPLARNTPLFIAGLSGSRGVITSNFLYDIWDCMDTPDISSTPAAYVNGGITGTTITLRSDLSSNNLQVGWLIDFVNASTGVTEASATIVSISGDDIVVDSSITVSDGAIVAPNMKGANLEFSPAPNGIYDIGMDYCAQLPDLVNTTDTFSFMDPFTGYIFDQATYYALSKGPSGDYQNYGSRAEMKLNRILAVASKKNMQGAEYVQGFLEDSY